MVNRLLGHVKITQQYYLDLFNQKSPDIFMKNRYEGMTGKKASAVCHGA